VFLPLFIPWFKLEAWPIGPVDIQPFGILVALGILFGSRVAEWRGERVGVPRQLTADFLLYTILIGFFFAMTLNVLFYHPERILETLQDSKKFKYPGLSSFGGFMGGVGAAIYFRQTKRASIFVLGDVFCFAFPFAWLFGRTGCFVVHDHPGVTTDFFLAVDNYNLGGLPRHDLGLYEVFWSAAMMALVLWLGRKPRPTGFFMALVPGLYAVVRFGLDFLREGPAEGGDVRYFGLTPGHYSSVLMLLAAIAVGVRVARGPEIALWLDGAPPEPYGEAKADSSGSVTVAPARRAQQRRAARTKRK
jgi:phosphatidylglycerol:prolipoprotein diacylglycerol transferase